jgi:cyclomaltodextrinase / maltogenic alpha-amylase / neopullulanase
VAAPQHDEIVIPGLANEAERAAYVRARRGGVVHERALSPRSPAPGEDVVVELTAGPQAPPGEAWIDVEGSRYRLELVGSEWDTIVWGYVRRYRGTLPGRPAGVVHYALGIGETLADGGAHHAYVVGDAGPPPWARDAIVYQVWVDRFWSGEDRSWPGGRSGPADTYGGTLVGLRERLDHVEALGANTVWLNPIHPSSAYHGYEVTDYVGVDPALGSLDDFDELVGDMHRRGLRLVLDFVPSHVSDRHPAFASARADASSPHVSWFRFGRWPDEYASFFDVPTMPRLNHDEPAVREHLVDAARFWLRRGVDGFRLDYAGGSSFELWAELRAVAREESPDCWLFGEVVDTPAAQLAYEGLLDGCLDFELAQALRGSFGYRDWDAVRLGTFLESHEAAFPAGFSRPSFLDNHDLDRMLWLTGGDTRRLRAAAVCQFTLSGPPIVYYGTEVGLAQQHGIKDAGAGGGDRHARLPMLWGADQDAALLRFYGELAGLRRSRPELREAPRELVEAEGTRLVYAREPLLVELDLEGAAVVRDGRDVLLRC